MLLRSGYINLLQQMLKFLEGIRHIVRYHDVTPGSQNTWNTSVLAITSTYKSGGEEEPKIGLLFLGFNCFAEGKTRCFI